MFSFEDGIASGTEGYEGFCWLVMYDCIGLYVTHVIVHKGGYNVCRIVCVCEGGGGAMNDWQKNIAVGKLDLICLKQECFASDARGERVFPIFHVDCQGVNVFENMCRMW